MAKYTITKGSLIFLVEPENWKERLILFLYGLFGLAKKLKRGGKTYWGIIPKDADKMLSKLNKIDE